MSIRVTAVEVCDARDDDSSNAVGQKNTKQSGKYKNYTIALNGGNYYLLIIHY